MAIFDLPAGHCCDFVGVLVDKEEIVVAVVERIGQFNELVVWGRARLIFVMVLRQPVVPNGRLEPFSLAIVLMWALFGWKGSGGQVLSLSGGGCRGAALGLLLLMVGVHGLPLNYCTT